MVISLSLTIWYSIEVPVSSLDSISSSRTVAAASSPGGDGIEGLATLKAEQPDLMILDLLMPKMDGFEVCKQLNQQAGSGGNKIPILILSAVRENSSRRRYELETKASPGIEDYVE